MPDLMAPFVTAMGVDVTLSVSMFGHSRMEETPIATRMSRMLQINHHCQIRDQGSNPRFRNQSLSPEVCMNSQTRMEEQ
jgi:hypothetical protein